MSHQEDDKKNMNRREFIGRSLKAGLTIAGISAIGYTFYRNNPPDIISLPSNEVTLKNYSIAEIGSKMVIAKGASRKETFDKAVKALGGIETFIKKDDIVLVKVNGAFATPPELCATTHPDLIIAIVQACLKAGAREVRVTDNPINDPESCFQLTGIEQATRTAGAKLYLPVKSSFSSVSLKGGKLIKDWPFLWEPLKEVTKLIGVAPLKDHHRSGASMTMKNWYGLLGGRRNIFHQDIHTIIEELALLVSPTLVVLDATVTMMTNGPTGGSLDDLKNTGLMIVSTDQVAADTFGAEILGKPLLPFIQKADKAGIGKADYKSLNPIMV
jgi:uncharacterized protein (DUF362 family)